jgi:hypothetical protein
MTGVPYSNAMSISQAKLRVFSLVKLGIAAFFLSYVLSNTYFLYTSPPFYVAKHLSIAALATLGTLWWLSRGDVPVRGRYAIFVISAVLLSLPYLWRAALGGGVAEILVAVEYILFGITVVVIAATAEGVGYPAVTYTIFFILGSTLAVALVAGLIAPEQLYNSYWGRPRLLLGFWHPKQLGTLLTSAALLLATNAILRVRPVLNWLGFFLLVGVMFFVDSRNMLLFSIIAVMAYYCAAWASYYVLWLGVAAAGAAAVWVTNRYPFLVDLAISGRLTLWRLSDYTLFGSGTRLEDLPGAALAKFHIDNFYLEYVLENGVYALALLVVLVGVLGYTLWHTRDRRWRRLKIAVAVAFFVTSIFDAGMFSTGNLMNILVWVYLLAAELIFVPAPAPRAEPAAVPVTRTDPVAAT